MKSVQKDVENAKNNLNVLFTNITREIESKLNEEYNKLLLLFEYISYYY